MRAYSLASLLALSISTLLFTQGACTRDNGLLQPDPTLNGRSTVIAPQGGAKGPASSGCETSKDCAPGYQCLFTAESCVEPPLRCGFCEACPALPPEPWACADGKLVPIYSADGACVIGHDCQGGCETPNPAGCAATGCPSGEICVESNLDVCAPSGCVCGDSGWTCTDDCVSPTICVPDKKDCADPYPGDCTNDPSLCGEGYFCATAVDACTPSACACSGGQWTCTADCNGYGVCVVKN
jgi:hypothetical protein